MTPEGLFSILNMTAVLGWLLLAIAPRWTWTKRIAGAAIPAALAVVYLAIVAFTWWGSEGGFSTLGDVASLFLNPWILLAGWTHYLVFDLLVGGWEVRDAATRGVPQLFLIPSLFLTFMFGPIGWLSYLGLRLLFTCRRPSLAPARSSPDASRA